MRNRRRRVVRAAAFGVFGMFVVAPAAQAATCVHTGGGNGTATLTFAAGDGTVTLSQNASGALTYAVGGGAAAACGTSTLTNSAQVNAVGSAGADTLVVDLAAGLFERPDESLAAIDASLAGGSDAVDVRLPDEDNVVVGGTLGADLDGDEAPT